MFDTTIRDRPQLWTADLWRQTYRFPRGGSGLSKRTEGHHEGRFMHQVDPKDGYSVSDCRVDRYRRLLEFMIPIVHPDKPTRVTITIGNTIFGVLDGGREVDWGVVFRDMVQRLAKGVGKPKPTPFAPFCSTSTKAKVCSQQTRTWTTGRPRRWPDTGSPRIRIAARIRRGRTDSNPSTLSATWAIANAQ